MELSLVPYYYTRDVYAFFFSKHNMYPKKSMSLLHISYQGEEKKVAQTGFFPLQNGVID